jgi:hypothetical protein
VLHEQCDLTGGWFLDYCYGCSDEIVQPRISDFDEMKDQTEASKEAGPFVECCL